MLTLRFLGMSQILGGLITGIYTRAVDPTCPVTGSIIEVAMGVTMLLIDWWRRGGRKIAEKAWGRVVILGHRLAVRPVPVAAN